MEDVEDDRESLLLGNNDDLSSDFGLDDEKEIQRLKRNDLTEKTKVQKVKLANKSEASDEYSREENRRERYHILTLDAYSRHKKIINDYLLFYGGSKNDFKRDSSKDKNDFDVIKEHHQFLWDGEDDAEKLNSSWEKRIAKKYYDKLYKEYCLADLSYYKKNKIAMRWRIEKEVVTGKGQFICGEKHCDEKEGLRSWEVNFAYVEHSQKKNALVKLRLCAECSYKLNYHHKRKEIKKSKNNKTSSVDQVDKNEIQIKKSKLDDTDNDTKSNDDTSESIVSKDIEKKDNTIGDDDIWKKELIIEVEKSREEEFDQYFEDMLM